MRLARFALCLAPIALAAAAPSHACSVASGYRIPSTLELVDRADTILLARVEEGAAYPDVPGILRARLVPTQLLKGDTLPAELDYDNALLSGEQLGTTPSDPRNLVDAHPDAFAGSCNRSVFDRGMILLIFLDREDGALRVMAPPFSRTLEDVPSPDALWVKAVKLYIEIAAHPRRERRKAMESRMIHLSLLIDDPDALLLAHELHRALRGDR